MRANIHQTKLMTAPSPDYFIFSREQALFEPLVGIDEAVTTGQIIAKIHRSDTLWEKSVEVKSAVDALVEVKSAVDALVVCKRALAQVKCGDCLFELAVPYSS